MCGLLGAFGSGIKSNWVEKNLNALRRRGPDSDRVEILDEYCTLGATRLAMVDPLPRSNQPLSKGNKSLVFNGELYNFRQLREQLKENYFFETDSDTEVLLALIDKEGIEGLSLVDGMFAFALYDKQSQIVTLARDNLGKKPLYYVLSEGNLYFSSLQDPLKEFKCGIQARALYDYLSFGFVIDPDSIYSQISAVLPGESIKFGLDQDKGVSVIRSEKRVARLKSTQFSGKSELRSRVIESVKARIEGHENVAISLSGGIDSSVIAIALAELGVQATAFSVRWPDSDKSRYNDDSIRAELIASQLRHNFVFVDCFESKNLPERIDLYLEIMEEPSSNPTGLSMIDLYAKVSKEGFRLALTGDGADELFGGYERHQKIGAFSRIPLARLSYSMIKKCLSLKNNEMLKLANFNFWSRWHRTFGHSEALSLLDSLCLDEESLAVELLYKYKRYEDSYRHSPLKQIQSLDQRIWLTMESNRRLDRISMYHSVEARSPFQDVSSQREFAGAQEKSLLTGVGKVNLIAAFPELMTLPISPNKVGFVSPLGHWMRSNSNFVRGRLDFLEETFQIQPQKIDELFKSLQSGKFTNLRKTWALLILSRFLENLFSDTKS